jgi:chorismate mutase/prephenate dehydratase
MKLVRLRKKIDSIDTQIVDLLTARARITKEIGRVKAKERAPAYVPDREKYVYERVLKHNKGLFTDESMKAIYREIMSASLRLERNLKIAYLGPELTFTHLAATKKFGSSVSYTSCNTIGDVFAEVEHGRADYGVVPIENSIEGAVNHTLDMFIESELRICSEVYLEISHNLLSRERRLERVKRIYSNPQVFGQCRLWLETNLPTADLVEVSSTAKAAGIASKERLAACIASLKAGQRYGLYVLANNIEDFSHNVTRFLIISKSDARPTSKDRTSLMFSIKDKVGALHDILIPFKRHGINLTKIESRPSKVRAWEYYFFVDLEGHHSNRKVSRVIEELRRESTYLKILGSYPVAGL